MKKAGLIFLLLAAVIAASLFYFQGHATGTPEKKPASYSTTSNQVSSNSADSIVVHGTARQDTAKVRVLLYAEDQTVMWVNGYAVINSFIPTGAPPQTVAEKYFDHRWQPVNPDDLVPGSVKPLSWK
jgi:hypothetical protein